MVYHPDRCPPKTDTGQPAEECDGHLVGLLLLIVMEVCQLSKHSDRDLTVFESLLSGAPLSAYFIHAQLESLARVGEVVAMTKTNYGSCEID